MPGDEEGPRADAGGMNRYPAESKPRQTRAAPRRMGLLSALALAFIVGSPHLVTAARAVVNLPVSAVAVAWARAHGGTCDVHDDLIVTCRSMRSGYADVGTTVGNVWMYGDLDGPDRHRHEARHADQWALFGVAFPVLYGADCIRTWGDLHQNVFERWAGLHDGGYRS